MLQTAILVFFPLVMVFAALSDLFTMTISNRISLALLVVFPVIALLAGQSWQDVLLHLACGAGVLVLTFGMFAFGWIGGGDAKLAAATAVWIGLDHLSDYGVVAGLAGGVLTLAILGMRQYPLPRFALKFDWVQTLHERGGGVPYGIALACAGLYMYPQTGLWRAALGA
jgi:prepilin peptidase CpaA